MGSVRAYVPGMLLLLGSALAWHARSQGAVPLGAPLAGVLVRPDGYRVEEQTFSDAERRGAGMSDYSARAYWRDSLVAFTTYVGYYDRQTQGRTIHSPRNCLPGAGWEVVEAGREALGMGAARHLINRYVLKNGSLTAVVYYWYQGRGRVVASEYEVKWNLLRDAALVGHTEEALVRVVVPAHRSPADADSARSRGLYAHADSLGKVMSARLIEDLSRVVSPRIRS